MEKVKMFLFARWIANCYADTHCDTNLLSENDNGFNSSEAISILNRASGDWYIKRLKIFNKTVYPNLVKNGTVESTKQFLK